MICSRGLGGDRPAAHRAMALADAGVQDAQVVVDLGDGADGGAGIAGGGLLLNADGRRQAAQQIDVGLLHLPHELAGIAGQGLDVAALPLGIESVEGQRTFAGAADAGEDDQLVARQVQVDIVQVVLPGAADDDGTVVHYKAQCSLGPCEGQKISIQVFGAGPQERRRVDNPAFSEQLFRLGCEYLCSLQSRGW